MNLANLLIKSDKQRLSLLKANLNATKFLIKHDKKTIRQEAEHYASTPKGLLSSFAAGSFFAILTEKESPAANNNSDAQEKPKNNSNKKSSREKFLNNVPWTALLAGLMRL